MIHCDAILHNSQIDNLLQFDPIQHPITLQLGGSNPINLAQASKIAVEQYNYDEINLNCGCPSPRVTCGSFGACLMKEPELVIECIKAMEQSVNVPITIKCRLGVDDLDSYEFLHDFIKKISESTKTTHFIIHARKAYLKGLNPKEYRTVPPLNYDSVFKLCKDFPSLKFTINGGIKSIDKINEFLSTNELNGCMIGRLAYENIWTLSTIDKEIYKAERNNYSKKEVLQIYGKYLDKVKLLNPKVSMSKLVKPLVSLFLGSKGSSQYRQLLSDSKFLILSKNFAIF